MIDREKIKSEGVGIIEEFSRMLAGIPETVETHYVVDMKNVTREDGKPEKQDFRGRLQSLAPRWEEGYVLAEKGV
jgi:predicted Asp-tRNA(Asn)/Glu-tRNA(Gln) amidotransferase subunit C